MLDMKTEQAHTITIERAEFEKTDDVSLAMKKLRSSCSALVWDQAQRHEDFLEGVRFAAEYFGAVCMARNVLEGSGLDTISVSISNHKVGTLAPR
ncbi:hypothetical protein [uncultured Roseovarius sp.]|uniref:hypothetical protein n=1 Tax=uncultured Roseovarius sp. TaxID=293344 RepID=UPI0025CF3859|nr:hypothetical protein [uncultured Roseovarius sp.]